MSSPLAEAFLLVTLNNCYETPSKSTSKMKQKHYDVESYRKGSHF